MGAITVAFTCSDSAPYTVRYQFAIFFLLAAIREAHARTDVIFPGAVTGAGEKRHVTKITENYQRFLERTGVCRGVSARMMMRRRCLTDVGEFWL
jgi:hypothetical protein